MHKKVTKTEANGKIVPIIENMNHFFFKMRNPPAKANAAAISPSTPKIKNPNTSEAILEP